jgi:hypothetical protein
LKRSSGALDAGGANPDNARRSGPVAVTFLPAIGAPGARLTAWSCCWRARHRGGTAGTAGGRSPQPPTAGQPAASHSLGCSRPSLAAHGLAVTDPACRRRALEFVEQILTAGRKDRRESTRASPAGPPASGPGSSPAPDPWRYSSGWRWKRPADPTSAGPVADPDQEADGTPAGIQSVVAAGQARVHRLSKAARSSWARKARRATARSSSASAMAKPIARSVSLQCGSWMRR